MQELTFLVKGSSKDPYEVIFIKEGDSLTAICNCPAGTYGNVCKHRVNILDGSAKGLSSNNSDDVATIVTWLVGSDVEVALTELRAAEKSTDKVAINDAKRKLARTMNS